MSLAGARFAGKAGAGWVWDAAAGRGTLTWAGHGLTGARGLTAGQMVHIGSLPSAGGAIQNGFNAAVYGFARLAERTANTLVFDRVSEDLQADVVLTTATEDFDILFGDFVTNVPVNHDRYAQIGHTIEQVSPNLFGAGSDGYEYALGNVIGTLVLNFPLTDKATFDATFVGTDTGKPVSARQTGAAAAADPALTEAFNTSSDIARLEILGSDDAGLTTDFKSLTITINPQSAGDKVLGKLGPRFINRGDLQIDTAAQVIFTDPDILGAIRDNETTGFYSIIGNGDGRVRFRCSGAVARRRQPGISRERQCACEHHRRVVRRR